MNIKKLNDLFRNRGVAGAVSFILPYVLAFFRGILRGYWMVFLGPGVNIRHRKGVKIGKFSRIESFVEIDGFGEVGVNIGRNCKIGKYSIIRVPPTPEIPGAGVAIADYTTIAEFCFLGGAGLVEIGEKCSIGQYVSIHPQNHIGPDKDSATEERGIKVCDNVWIGAKATLLDGTFVDSNTIIGACALLNKRYTSGTVIGIPAKNVP
ncbi:MAG: acetyltransferase-like isoleucine patch superfamily enzyme [Gammaproteobacteria bacterium]|jgi:acetyltransferase-like isoleucine patch superfamily enzyme